MIRMAVVGALMLAVGMSSAVAGLMLGHSSLTRNAALEFKKPGDDLQKQRPAVLKIMSPTLATSPVANINAANTKWSAWWHS